MLLLLVALPLGLAARLAVGWGLPLWLDEVFTGTIAGQPNFAGLVRWCLSELSGPAFYMPMWAWVRLFGAGDTALRLPPLLMSVAVAGLIAWRGHPEREVRLWWASFSLLWLPILPMATEARPYPQLFLLCTAQAIAFLRVARRADRIGALLWSGATAAGVLTNYYALVIGGLQGVALLFLLRRRAWRLWPAAAPLLVAAGWMAFHLPMLLQFAGGHVAAYEPMAPVWVVALPWFLFGQGWHGLVILGVVAFTRPLWWRREALRSAESLLIVTGVVGVALIFGAGFVRATMQPRYLTPCVPALLFGLALCAARSRKVSPAAIAILAAAFVVPMLAALAFGPVDVRFRERRHFEFETASAWLAERNPDRLHFLWSTATGAQSNSDGLAEVAGFFFRRAGRPVAVTVERLQPNINRGLLAAAAGDPRAAILWISDDRLPAGVSPAIDRLDRSWECRDFGGDRILVLACRRRAA